MVYHSYCRKPVWKDSCWLINKILRIASSPLIASSVPASQPTQSLSWWIVQRGNRHVKQKRNKRRTSNKPVSQDSQAIQGHCRLRWYDRGSSRIRYQNAFRRTMAYSRSNGEPNLFGDSFARFLS
jgi:hypothetical protein